MACPHASPHEACICLAVDSSVYSVSALLRTCYWFTDRAFVFIEKAGPTSYRVKLSPKDDSTDVSAVAGDFGNRLLEDQLRVELAEQTRVVRELIVAKAFAEGNLLEDPVPGTCDDPVAGALQALPPRQGPP